MDPVAMAGGCPEDYSPTLYANQCQVNICQKNQGLQSAVSMLPLSLGFAGDLLIVSGNRQVSAAQQALNSMDPDVVARAFVYYFYSKFDADRAGLANLYQDSSMLTFDGQKIQGSQNIIAMLTGPTFQQCKHSITSVDCQPSGPAGGILVFVSGHLQLAGQQQALKFSQMFHLMPTAQGSFYVLNDICRLN